MTVRKLFLLAVFGLWVAGSAVAQDAASLAANQKLADSVAEKLRSSGIVKKGAKVSIETREGVVSLSGTVIDADQHSEVLKAISDVKGIQRIESSIVFPGMPAPIAAAPVAAPGGYGALQRTAMQFEGAGLGAGPMVASNEPAPLNGGPAMAPIDPAGPRLPPYAWPTYAPYNNMSRVAYPQSYPYNAFPYIGPFYPFPKVPLGWRKVVLEWEDGHWYYGKLASPQEMWRVKFW